MNKVSFAIYFFVGQLLYFVVHLILFWHIEIENDVNLTFLEADLNFLVSLQMLPFQSEMIVHPWIRLKKQELQLPFDVVEQY